MKLSLIESGNPVSLRISANGKNLRLDAVVIRNVEENTIIVQLQDEFKKKLNFNNVKTDLEFYPDGNIPIKWYEVQVVSTNDGYLVRAPKDGTRMNRRSTFRVGISATATLKTSFPNCPNKVTIRDISLTGFSITDRKRELPFVVGNKIAIEWKDFGHELDLVGRLIRIEDRDDATIFGFEICNICKDLSSYISTKQLQQRKK